MVHCDSLRFVELRLEVSKLLPVTFKTKGRDGEKAKMVPTPNFHDPANGPSKMAINPKTYCHRVNSYYMKNTI